MFFDRDFFLWSLLSLLLIGATVVHYLMEAWSPYLRVSGWLVVVLLAGIIFLRTNSGKRLWSFSQLALDEMFKVDWPARKEVFVSSGLVVLAILVFSLVLWGVDACLSLGINSFFQALG